MGAYLGTFWYERVPLGKGTDTGDFLDTALVLSA